MVVVAVERFKDQKISYSDNGNRKMSLKCRAITAITLNKQNLKLPGTILSEGVRKGNTRTFQIICR